MYGPHYFQKQVLCRKNYNFKTTVLRICDNHSKMAAFWSWQVLQLLKHKKKHVNSPPMNMVWCKWQVPNSSCPLSSKKGSGKQKLISSGLWIKSCEVNDKSTKQNCLGFPKQNSIRIGFYQGKNYRSYYLTIAQTSIQKEFKILTFDVQELHISQCWLPELTYRWHIVQNLEKDL